MALNNPITLKEVDSTLKLFAKDKSPGFDGWTVEFFLHLFDILRPELVRAIEEYLVSSAILEKLNKTFLTLIPKVDQPASFADYRPISLCNLFYKLISKIIAERFKHVLGKFISLEQFGFLPNR